MKTTILTMTSTQYEDVFNHLFPGDGLESAAILLCNQGTGKLHRRLIVSDILYPSHHLSERKEDSLSWPFAACLPPDKICDIDQKKQCIITIHSHPDGYDRFSDIDDSNDRELFYSVCNWFDDGRPHGSAIMLSNGQIKARTVDVHGIFFDMPTVSVVGENIQIWKPHKHKRQTAYQNKVLQTFGGETLDVLHNMRVGVIGCSGTGSILIELLIRNCVEIWLLPTMIRYKKKI